MPLIFSEHSGFGRDGRRVYFLDMGGDAPPPPDYGPMAQASKETAEISAKLGREQLAQAQQQYDQSMAVARPVVDAQMRVMQQGISQGDDYYNYGKSFRPLEQEMAAQARGGLTAADVVRMQKMGLGGLRQAAVQAPDQSQDYPSGMPSNQGQVAAPPAQAPVWSENPAERAIQEAAAGQTAAFRAQYPTYGVPQGGGPAFGSGGAAAAPTASPTSSASPMRTAMQTGIGAPQSGAMTASGIAANSSAARQGIAANAATAWQQQQDAKRAELQRSIGAARSEEAAIQAKALADSKAKTDGLSMSYIDPQGGVRAADSYRNITAGQSPKGASPGEGYSYFEFDNPDAGKQTPRTIQVGDGEQTVYDSAPARTGAWLKSGKVGVADPSLSGSTSAQVDPKTLRSYQLQQQLDALSSEKFDPSKVDYGTADAAQGTQAMDGAMVRAMMDQAEMDQITGAAQSNANRLATRTRAYEADAFKDIGDYTGGDTGILNRYRSDIDADVGRAVADARTGQTSAMNSAIRQAMRYGLNAPASTAGLASSQASQIAAAANNTRNSAIDNYRSLVGQGIGLKRDAFTTGQAATLDSMNKGEQALRSGRDMRIQNESLDWAKKLDVTGLARGMPGASQGAYSVATNAGNSAVSNQMAPGQALQGAMGQSSNTQLQGRQIAQQGLGSVLSSQTSYANANQGGSDLGGLGALLGGGAKLYSAMSDRRLKTNIEVVGRDANTGLKIYEFSYISKPGRFRGVMADEVKEKFPQAVERDDSGFDRVDYGMLGLKMEEVSQ